MGSTGRRNKSAFLVAVSFCNKFWQTFRSCKLMPDFCSFESLIFLVPNTSLRGCETADCASAATSGRTPSFTPSLILGSAAGPVVERGRSALAGVVVLESRSTDGILSLILGRGSSLGLMRTSQSLRRHQRISKCVDGALCTPCVSPCGGMYDKRDLQNYCHHRVSQHDTASDGVSQSLQHRLHTL